MLIFWNQDFGNFYPEARDRDCWYCNNLVFVLVPFDIKRWKKAKCIDKFPSETCMDFFDKCTEAPEFMKAACYKTCTQCDPDVTI